MQSKSVDMKKDSHREGCLICGDELVYHEDTSQKVACYICKREKKTNVHCVNDHFVCDKCHSSDANDLIFQYCNNTESTDAVFMVNEIMNAQQMHMHGAEHHYLVPAVLITAFYNEKGEERTKAMKLLEAKKRAANVPGGFCGYYGTCGAGVGSGIFVSVITQASPLSGKEYQQAHELTSSVFGQIAYFGGPRCCKRNVYLAIEQSINYSNANFGSNLPLSESIECTHYPRNKECKTLDCKYFPGAK